MNRKMFTGIIQAVEPILSVMSAGECKRVRIQKPRGWKLALGQSIAVDGVCSTVIAQKPDFFEVEYMPETRTKTTVNSFAKGTRVNLDRPLTLKDSLDGSLVQGHVDARGIVCTVIQKGTSKIITIKIPSKLKKYIAPKGSIVISGVSLTVVTIQKNVLSVALIPYTLSHTNLTLLKKGDSVNVEVDVLARYVEKMMLDKR